MVTKELFWLFHHSFIVVFLLFALHMSIEV